MWLLAEETLVSSTWLQMGSFGLLALIIMAAGWWFAMKWYPTQRADRRAELKMFTETCTELATGFRDEMERQREHDLDRTQSLVREIQGNTGKLDQLIRGGYGEPYTSHAKKGL